MPCRVDIGVAEKIYAVAQDLKIDSALGGTMGADDFYLGQGRLDGAFCDYKLEDKMAFLNDLHDSYGIRNIEMEAHILSAFTYRARVKCSIVCVTLLNRLLGDQVTTPKEILMCFEGRPLTVVSEFVKRECEERGLLK